MRYATVMKQCPRCEGTGHEVYNLFSIECRKCEGTGDFVGIDAYVEGSDTPDPCQYCENPKCDCKASPLTHGMLGQCDCPGSKEFREAMKTEPIHTGTKGGTIYAVAYTLKALWEAHVKNADHFGDVSPPMGHDEGGCWLCSSYGMLTGALMKEEPTNWPKYYRFIHGEPEGE